MATNPIQSIETLLDRISSGTGFNGYEDLFSNLQIPLESLSPFLHWQADAPCRISLANLDTVELLLVCWEPGQETSIHNYGGSEGWIYPLHGRLTLETFSVSKVLEEARQVHTAVLETGQLTYENDYTGMHRFLNPGPNRAISLHLYAEPVSEWEVFDPNTQTISREATHYDFTHALA